MDIKKQNEMAESIKDQLTTLVEDNMASIVADLERTRNATDDHTIKYGLAFSIKITATEKAALIDGTISYGVKKKASCESVNIKLGPDMFDGQ